MKSPNTLCRLTWALFVYCLCSFFIAQVSAQCKEDTCRVTINVIQLPVVKVLWMISDQTGLLPTYGDAADEINKNITVNYKNEKLSVVLSDLQVRTGCIFQIMNNTLFVKKGRPAPTANNNGTIITAPGRGISGKVIKRKDSTPVAGATVMVKGVRNATVTNEEGIFTLFDVKESDTLVITCVGYEAKEVRAAERNGVQLEESIRSLTEAVVLAPGSLPSQKFPIYNKTVIKAVDIERQPVSNPLLTMQGRVPGLFVEQATGLAGSGVKVRIRGQNSLQMDNDPLIVVDGVPYPSHLPTTLTDIQGRSGSNTFNTHTGAGSPLGYINPLDIDSMTVLKDVEAAAIFGGKAANGVVLITTKRGTPGPAKWQVHLETGLEMVPRKLHLLNTSQHLQLRKSAYINDGVPVPDRSTAPTQDNLDLTWYDPARYTDWQQVLIGNIARTSNLHTSVSGGSKRTQYQAGAGYRRQTTVFPGQLADDKCSLHFSLQHRSDKPGLNISFTGNYLMDDNSLIAEDPTKDAISMVPNAPALYNRDGTLNWDTLPNGESSWNNPLARLHQPYHNKTGNLIAAITINYEVLRGLNISAVFGYNSLRINETLGLPVSTYSPQTRAQLENKLLAALTKVHTWSMDPQLSYSRPIGKGTLIAILGYTLQENTVSREAVSAWGFSSEHLMNSIAAAKSKDSSESASGYRYSAIYGSLNYNWRDKYSASFSIRRDGSSRFVKENRSYTFGTLSAAWTFSNEALVKNNLPFLSLGKLKAGYGITGNDGVNEEPLIVYNRLLSFNPNPRWELIEKVSFGMDLGGWRDRLFLSINYYHNRSFNRLLDNVSTGLTGFPPITRRFSAVIQNTGWEFELYTKGFPLGECKWKVYANLTLPQNRLLDFPGLQTTSYAQSYRIGKPINIIPVYQFTGIDPQTGLSVIMDKDGKPLPPGAYGEIEDRVAAVNMEPRYYGGIGNNFTYGKMELDFFFQFVKQNGPLYNWGNPPGQFYGVLNTGNQPVDVLKTWQKPGDITTIPKASSGASYPDLVSYINIMFSNAVYGDASYVRLKNVSLSYTFGDIGKRQAGLKVFLQAQNLFTFTGYKGLDPETKNVISLPPLRTMTIGVHLSI